MPLFGIVFSIPVTALIYFFGFIHKDKQSKEEGYSSVDEHFELEGHIGVAKTDMRPAGIAIIDGQRLDVMTQGEFLHKGDTLQVIAIRNGAIIVKKV